MKKVFIQTILALAPVVVLAQKSEKENPPLGSNKNSSEQLLLDNSKAAGAIKLLPNNFPAVNGNFLLNNNAGNPVYQIPNQTANTNNTMPCLIPDMNTVTSMPVITGIVNNRLPEPMPGAFIYKKKKK